MTKIATRSLPLRPGTLPPWHAIVTGGNSPHDGGRLPILFGHSQEHARALRVQCDAPAPQRGLQRFQAHTRFHLHEDRSRLNSLAREGQEIE